jgi:hypothetical protein
MIEVNIFLKEEYWNLPDASIKHDLKHQRLPFLMFSLNMQVLALAYYAISYFPGGSAGLKFLSSSLTSSVMRRFGS